MLFAGLRTLLALQRTEEALFATEQGRAQGLTNLMLLHGLEVLLSGLTNSKETVSYISSSVNTEAVFLALEGSYVKGTNFALGKRK